MGAVWLTVFHELGNAEQASASATISTPSVELGQAEGKARRAGLDVGADDAQEQAETRSWPRP